MTDPTFTTSSSASTLDTSSTVTADVAVASPVPVKPSRLYPEPTVAAIPPVFVARTFRHKTLGTEIDKRIAANPVLSDESRTLIARIYNKFRHRIAPALRGNNDPMLWIELISDMMALANRFKVSGPERKEILLEVIDMVIENEIPESERSSARFIVSTVVSPAIDLAVKFAEKIWPSCRKRVFPCC